MLTALTFCFGIGNIRAQTGNATYFQPSVFPSSPNTAAFAKFGNYPVNMYTGVPEISIPLYIIESGGLKVPVTLSYHASGIRVADAASWVGLGWSLNCGGSITRQVMGTPDETGFLLESRQKNFNLQNNNDLDYVQQTVEYQEHDNMPDIYSYQIPGYNGKFFYEADSSFKIMNVPRSPLLIKGTFHIFDSHQYETYTQKFNITDEHGNLFTLGADVREITSNTSLGGNTPKQAASAWMLENMISQNRRDSITFKYNPHTFTLPDGMTEVITVEDSYQQVNDYGQGYGTNSPQTVLVNNPSTIVEQQLSTVYFKNGKVDFILGKTGRQDIGNTQYASSTVYSLDTMKVSIYNFSTKKYEVQKSIVFSKSYFGANNSLYRLRLDGIQVLDKAGSIVDQYHFTYNTAVSLPAYGSLARDYWGYYNGRTDANDLIPQTSIQVVNGGGGISNMNIGNTGGIEATSRNIDTTKMQAYTLTSITYPTGGHTDFNYQTNRYFDVNKNMFLAGGLRVNTISSYDSQTATVPIVHTYRYDAAQPNFVVDASENLNYGFFVNSETYRDWVSLAGPDPDEIGGYTVGATKRVRHYYAQPTIDLSPDGVPVAYTRVTEFTGTPGANTGKSTSLFSWTKSSIQGGGGETGNYYLYDYAFENGLLLNKTDSMLTANGTYQIVKSVANTYHAWPDFYYDEAGTAMGQRNYNDGALAGNPAYYQQETPDDEQTYPQGDFVVQSGDNYLTSSTTTMYDQLNPAKYTSSITSYKYDDQQHQQVAQISHVDSKGNTAIAVSKFPYSYASGNAVIDSMVSRHMWAEPIEKYDTLKDAATGVNAVVSGQLNTSTGSALMPAAWFRPR